MLQQTRVEAVKSYYNRFMRALPDIRSLAECPDEKLEKLWEGLGYYSRARNLKRAALTVMRECGGKFPGDFTRIRSLPGIGNYTAAAIASICWDLPYPAVDGNVLRVVSRLTGSESDITQESTKTAVRELLLPLYKESPCGKLTQAFMELGALVCVPKRAPYCDDCPLYSSCAIAGTDRWENIPVKKPKKPKSKEEYTVFLLSSGQRFAIRRREKKGILSGLWEFPNVPGRLDSQEALDTVASWGCRPDTVLRRIERRHIFTHKTWELIAYRITCNERPDRFVWSSISEIKADYSLPTAFRQFMEDISDD